MKSVVVTTVLKDLYDSVYASPRSSRKNGFIELTNGEIYVQALMSPTERSESYESSLYKVELAKKIKTAQEEGSPVELDDKEIQLLEALVPMANNLPLVVAQAVGLLKKEN